MDADRAVDIGSAFGDGAHAREAGKSRPNRQEMADALRARGIEHAVDLVAEIGKVEMAMAVDQHGANLSDWEAEFKRGEAVSPVLESGTSSVCRLLEGGGDPLKSLVLPAHLVELSRRHCEIVLWNRLPRPHDDEEQQADHDQQRHPFDQVENNGIHGEAPSADAVRQSRRVWRRRWRNRM